MRPSHRPEQPNVDFRSALKRGGRQRNIERRAGEIQTALRTGQLAAPATVADAVAATTRAGVAIIAELNRQIVQIVQIEATLTASFEQHPDSATPNWHQEVCVRRSRRPRNDSDRVGRLCNPRLGVRRLYTYAHPPRGSLPLADTASSKGLATHSGDDRSCHAGDHRFV